MRPRSASRWLRAGATRATLSLRRVVIVSGHVTLSSHLRAFCAKTSTPIVILVAQEASALLDLVQPVVLLSITSGHSEPLQFIVLLTQLLVWEGVHLGAMSAMCGTRANGSGRTIPPPGRGFGHRIAGGPRTRLADARGARSSANSRPAHLRTDGAARRHLRFDFHCHLPDRPRGWPDSLYCRFGDIQLPRGHRGEEFQRDRRGRGAC